MAVVAVVAKLGFLSGCMEAAMGYARNYLSSKIVLVAKATGIIPGKSQYAESRFLMRFFEIWNAICTSVIMNKIMTKYFQRT